MQKLIKHLIILLNFDFLFFFHKVVFLLVDLAGLGFNFYVFADELQAFSEGFV